MGKLNAKARKMLPDSDFGLPAERKYPMPDRSHAADAKARASGEAHKGVISTAQLKAIDEKADVILQKDREKK